jgi:hypothetical protein
MEESWNSEKEEFLDRLDELKNDVDGYVSECNEKIKNREEVEDVSEYLLEDIDMLADDFGDTDGLIAEWLFDKEDREAMTAEMLYQLINE